MAEVIFGIVALIVLIIVSALVGIRLGKNSVGYLGQILDAEHALGEDRTREQVPPVHPLPDDDATMYHGLILLVTQLRLCQAMLLSLASTQEPCDLEKLKDLCEVRSRKIAALDLAPLSYQRALYPLVAGGFVRPTKDGFKCSTLGRQLADAVLSTLASG